MNSYFMMCKKCKKKTRHIERLVNRLRGVKVACCECGEMRGKYVKFDCLNKLKVEVASDLGIVSNPNDLNKNQEVQNG
jgi:uncharacterized Zn finger protein